MIEKLTAKKFFEKGSLPLCVFRMPYVDWSRSAHVHDFHEMMIVIGGVAVHHLDEHLVTVSMGDVFVIPPGHVHGYDVPENSGVQVLNILFDLKRLNINMRDLEQIPGFHALFSVKLSNHHEPHLKLHAKDLAFVNSIIEVIEAEQEEMAPGYEFFCETKFQELMVFLARRYSHVATPSGKNVLKLGELISYMEKNLGENLSFEDVAAAIHMSPTSLRRAFQETFACSPMAYLQQLRVKRAMLLLADPLKSISDVAFEVGFNDSGYFSRVFKVETDETPKEFRKRI
jgi:AraC family L-rhamnose operon transcriptional activator RhaR/AraC family L-rhamnose operon regulatory protein RhaS